MEQNSKILWERCLEIIKDNITPQQFSASFAFVNINRFDEGNLVLEVPSDFVMNLLETEFRSLLRSTLIRVFGNGSIKQLYYKVLIDKDDNISSRELADNNPIIDNGAGASGDKSPDMLTAPQVQDLDSQLHMEYNFGNYIEGDSNRLARSVGETIAMNPAKTFNPLFVYGPSGCGKTHLVNAIGIRAKELHPELRVLYVSAYLFMVQWTDAVRFNKRNDFIAFYQTIDILIIDDIQELTGKKDTQNTFFQIFNHLQLNKKQIILTADRPPVAIKDVEDRLLTRFKWGLVAEIQKPTSNLRHEILASKINKVGLNIPQHIIRYISDYVQDSVRDLEGVINSLMAHAVTYNCEINMKLVQKVLPNFVNIEAERPVGIELIKDKVCEFYNLDVKELESKTRKQSIVNARQVAMYLADSMTDFSFVQIGLNMGKRNHATVIHAVKQIKGQLDLPNNTIFQEIEEIKEMIRNAH